MKKTLKNVCLLLPFISLLYSNNWENVSPPGGIFRAIDFLPPNIFYMVGWDNGVWKSEDTGRTWVKISDLYDDIWQIQISRKNPDIIFIGAWDRIYRSLDGGYTWEVVGDAYGIHWPILLHPESDRLIFAAGGYRSTDAGNTWEKMDLPDETNWYGVSISSPNIIFAGTASPGGGLPGEIWRSIDYGETWVKVFSVPNTVFGPFGFDPNDPSRIYCRASSYGAGTYLLFSPDTGRTWEVRAGGGGVYMYKIVVDKNNPNLVLIAGGVNGVWRSVDGGYNFIQSNTGITPNAFVCDIIQDPEKEFTYYIPCLKGFAVSRDGGMTWNVYNEGLKCAYTDGIAFDPYNKDIIYAGCLGLGIAKTENGGENWTFHYNGLTDPEEDFTISAVAVDPNDPQKVYFTTSPSPSYYFPEGYFFVSSDGGVTWTKTQSLTAYQSSGTSIIQIDNNSNIYVGAFCTEVYGPFGEMWILKSTDGGSNFTNVNPFIQGYYTSLKIDSRNVLYMGTWSGSQSYGLVVKSEDGGTNWTAFMDGSNSYIFSAVGICEVDSNIAFAGNTGGWLYKTTDRGGTWFPVINFNYPIFDIQFKPNSKDTVIIALGRPTHTYWTHGSWEEYPYNIPCKLFITYNGGITFDTFPCPVKYINRIIWRDDSTLFVTGRNGIYKYVFTNVKIAEKGSEINNPFFTIHLKNGNLILSYYLDRSSPISLSLIDPSGRKTRLYEGYSNEGEYIKVFNLKNKVKSGIYFVTLSLKNKKFSRKILILK